MVHIRRKKTISYNAMEIGKMRSNQSLTWGGRNKTNKTNPR